MPCYRSARQRYSADKRPLTTNQWVEYQKFWLEAGDGGMERLLMLEVIEPKC